MFRALLVGLFATGVVLTSPTVTPDPVPTEWNKAGKGKTYVLSPSRRQGYEPRSRRFLRRSSYR